ncbi:hypothetical protein BDN72DRAFT_435561 [Pluteus cervinus]|uniref:Uncharacterized protein n=1 Tax=Pluteus cervinus TaxID=181527 RepID=A0ACD3A7D1_9AGAR|nr:hypothetical protein BDN72DRAFT_435561 [Pluteus cervinus]
MNSGTPHISESDLISSCPNISNLMLWFGTTLIPDILNLPIKRFSTRSFGFLEDRWAVDPNEAKLVAWCSKITHIALVTLEKEESRHLAHFPALEYLMILGSMANGREGIMGALQHCPQLKVVVWLLGPVSDVTRTQAVKDGGDSDSDIRIVKVDGLITADWSRGAQGLEDMWDVAEEEVGMRREDHSPRVRVDR